MKQYKQLIITLSGATLLAIFVAALVFFVLGHANDSTEVETIQEEGQLSLADRLATIDPSYLTRAPTAGPSSTSEAANSVDTATESSTPPNEEPQPEATIHTVQAGDNLFRISLSYGVSIESIMSANGLSDDAGSHKLPLLTETIK